MQLTSDEITDEEVEKIQGSIARSQWMEGLDWDVILDVLQDKTMWAREWHSHGSVVFGPHPLHGGFYCVSWRGIAEALLGAQSLALVE